MTSRVSSVGQIRITDTGATAVFEIGDSKQISPVNHSIAVQREKAIYFQNEFNFRDYAIFFRPISESVLNEKIRMTTINESAVIGVQNIDVFAISGAAVVQIGSSEALRAETRIKHIRHLLRERPQRL
ncbi:spore germination protein GerPE [Paenibacillus sp. sptzw28]|uniref:spore germination protein GerPE n=1 Tax=Paenibacillus sp. sptzw28 TaxID=715179 RepID=UPI001C6F5330|nr:spore germination protein GerPE [Paenibacillus sp. sptzw28]QYR22593.1 spore germination protein GerPE [Paenibacillus sp. sptzw28]